VLGTALAIKMSAYILVAPVAAAFADKFPRRTMLVTWTWFAPRGYHAAFCHPDMEIYILIFILQAASAAFTPTSRQLSRIFFLTNVNIPGRCLCHVWPTILKASSALCWRLHC
jgi:predicted MFS family arabinose efflux permease